MILQYSWHTKHIKARNMTYITNEIRWKMVYNIEDLDIEMLELSEKNIDIENVQISSILKVVDEQQ